MYVYIYIYTYMACALAYHFSEGDVSKWWFIHCFEAGNRIMEWTPSADLLVNEGKFHRKPFYLTNPTYEKPCFPSRRLLRSPMNPTLLPNIGIQLWQRIFFFARFGEQWRTHAPPTKPNLRYDQVKWLHIGLVLTCDPWSSSGWKHELFALVRRSSESGEWLSLHSEIWGFS